MKLLRRIADFEVRAPECCLLSLVLLSTFLASCGFVVGCSISGLMFWCAVSIVLTPVAIYKWRFASFMLIGVFALLALTAYTFDGAYVDAVQYHLPTQILLMEGWNPVWQSTIEEFRQVVGEGKGMWPYHVLFLPKYGALCGAIIAKATGLWSALPFLNYVMVIALSLTAYRFAKEAWNVGRVGGVVFGGALVFSRQVSSILAPGVDYITYAAFAVAVLSAWLVVRTYSAHNLFLLFSSLAIGVLTKSTLTVTSLLLVVFLIFVCARHGCSFWWVLGAFVLFCAVVGLSPYLTNFINYGSPFYPLHSFSSSVPIIDITNDFSGNQDLVSMGYLSRVTYAWFSSDWTVWAMRMIRHNSLFRPESTVGQGVEGLGAGFRVLMWISVFSLCLSRVNGVTLICIFTFVVSNFVPLKYVGYPRYCPQIWIVPVLSFYNLIYAPRIFGATYIRKLRPILIGMFSVAVCLLVIRFIVLFARYVALEGIRQEAIENVKIKALQWDCCIDEADNGLDGRWYLHHSSFGFAFKSRLKCDGITFRNDRAGCPKLLRDDGFIPHIGIKDEYDQMEFDREFPIVSRPQDIWSFHWGRLLQNLPHPVFVKE